MSAPDPVYESCYYFDGSLWVYDGFLDMWHVAERTIFGTSNVGRRPVVFACGRVAPANVHDMKVQFEAPPCYPSLTICSECKVDHLTQVLRR